MVVVIDLIVLYVRDHHRNVQGWARMFSCACECYFTPSVR